MRTASVGEYFATARLECRERAALVCLQVGPRAAQRAPAPQPHRRAAGEGEACGECECRALAFAACPHTYAAML
jgi:hypothetical protein